VSIIMSNVHNVCVSIQCLFYDIKYNEEVLAIINLCVMAVCGYIINTMACSSLLNDHS